MNMFPTNAQGSAVSLLTRCAAVFCHIVCAAVVPLTCFVGVRCGECISLSSDAALGAATFFASLFLCLSISVLPARFALQAAAAQNSGRAVEFAAAFVSASVACCIVGGPVASLVSARRQSLVEITIAQLPVLDPYVTTCVVGGSDASSSSYRSSIADMPYFVEVRNAHGATFRNVAEDAAFNESAEIMRQQYGLQLSVFDILAPSASTSSTSNADNYTTPASSYSCLVAPRIAFVFSSSLPPLASRSRTAWASLLVSRLATLNEAAPALLRTCRHSNYFSAHSLPSGNPRSSVTSSLSAAACDSFAQSHLFAQHGARTKTPLPLIYVSEDTLLDQHENSRDSNSNSNNSNMSPNTYNNTANALVATSPLALLRQYDVYVARMTWVPLALVLPLALALFSVGMLLTQGHEPSLFASAAVVSMMVLRWGYICVFASAVVSTVCAADRNHASWCFFDSESALIVFCSVCWLLTVLPVCAYITCRMGFCFTLETEHKRPTAFSVSLPEAPTYIPRVVLFPSRQHRPHHRFDHQTATPVDNYRRASRRPRQPQRQRGFESSFFDQFGARNIYVDERDDAKEASGDEMDIDLDNDDDDDDDDNVSEHVSMASENTRQQQQQPAAAFSPSNADDGHGHGPTFQRRTPQNYFFASLPRSSTPPADSHAQQETTAAHDVRDSPLSAAHWAPPSGAETPRSPSAFFSSGQRTDPTTSRADNTNNNNNNNNQHPAGTDPFYRPLAVEYIDTNDTNDATPTEASRSSSVASRVERAAPQSTAGCELL